MKFDRLMEPAEFNIFANLLPDVAKPPDEFDCTTSASYVVKVPTGIDPNGEARVGVWFTRGTFYVYTAHRTPIGCGKINGKGGLTLNFKKLGIQKAWDLAVKACDDGSDITE